jgi:hypothetical protein
MKRLYLLMSIVAIIAFAVPVFAVDSLPTKAGFGAGIGLDYTGLKLTSPGSATLKAQLATAYVALGYDAKIADKFIIGFGANVGAGAFHMKLDENYVGTAIMAEPKIKAAYLLSKDFQIGVVGSYKYFGKTNDKLLDNKVEAGAINMITVKPTLQWKPFESLAIFGGPAMRFASMGHVKSPYVDVPIKVKDAFGGNLGIALDVGSFTLGVEGQAMSSNGSGGGATLSYRF